MASKRIGESVGERVRILREHSGLTAYAISQLAELGENSHVRLVEEGKRAHPSAETLVQIARVLGTTVEWLVTGEGPGPTRLQVCTAVAAAEKRLKRAAAKANGRSRTKD